MKNSPFYILPGKNRSEDLIFRREEVEIVPCKPKVEKISSMTDQQYKPSSYEVTVFGMGTGYFPFVLPCGHEEDWDSLGDVADQIGSPLVEGRPVQDHEPLESAIVTSYFALTDGSVYKIKRSDVSGPLAASRLPVTVTFEIPKKMRERERDIPGSDVANPYPRYYSRG